MAAIRFFSKSFAANEQIRVHQVGTFVRCLAGAAVFDVQPDEQNSVQMQEGIGIRYQEKFNSLIIVNGATTQTISVYIGDGDLQDSRLYGTITTLPVGTEAGDNAVDVTLASATDESTIAANGDRVILRVQADIDNTTDIRVGTTVSDTRGLVLTPGASVALTHKSAVIVRNPTGGAANQKFRYDFETQT